MALHAIAVISGRLLAWVCAAVCGRAGRVWVSADDCDVVWRGNNPQMVCSAASSQTALGVAIVVWLIAAVVCGVIGGFIGQAKGRRRSGYLLGLLFGPIGLIVVAVLPATVDAEAARLAAVARRAQELA